MGDRHLTSSSGRPLCDECSDVIEAHETRVRADDGRLLHDDCAGRPPVRLHLVAS